MLEQKKTVNEKSEETLGSVDAIAMLDEDYFITGADNGSISLWHSGRKKPLFTRLKAHGSNVVPYQDETLVNHSRECKWITALAALPFTDLFASGSSDGVIKLWKLGAEKRNFTSIASIPMVICFFNFSLEWFYQ